MEFESNKAYRWEVAAGEGDLDVIAELIVRVRMAERPSGARLTVRSSLIAVGAVGALLVIALSPSATPFAVVGLIAWVGLVAWWLPRANARRLARELRAIPAASEASVFVASPEGTTDTLPSGSSLATWSRWKRALVVDGHLVLVSDQNALRFLPWDALKSSAPPEVVLADIQRWLVSAATDQSV